MVDGVPGEECQLDTGWVLRLEPDARGKRRRRRAWIFTASVSRHRFVYPIERETTASAIEACEAAWEFFGGIFKVLLPDNTKAIVQRADPLEPRIRDLMKLWLPVFLGALILSGCVPAFGQECFSGDCKNGQGTLTFPDGRKYVGEFRDNEMNGQGTYTWPNGRKYVGEFRNDEPTGQGKWTPQ